MKRLWAVVVIIAVVTGLFLLLRSKNPPPLTWPAQTETVSENSSNSSAAQAGSQTASSVSSNGANANGAAPNELASHAASPNPPSGSATTASEEPALPPATVLDKARVVMHNYRSAFGENPVGTNPEITAALMGKNAKQVNFVADSGLRVNEKGEMVDAYGTPFFFHQISGQVMEIRSAGPDHVMWTSDDLVTR